MTFYFIIGVGMLEFDFYVSTLPRNPNIKLVIIHICFFFFFSDLLNIFINRNDPLDVNNI